MVSNSENSTIQFLIVTSYMVGIEFLYIYYIYIIYIIRVSDMFSFSDDPPPVINELRMKTILYITAEDGD